MSSPSSAARRAVAGAVRLARTSARSAAQSLPPEQRARVRRVGGRALRTLPDPVAAPLRRLAGAGVPTRRAGGPAVTGRGAAAVGADPRAAARLEAALGLVDVSRTPSGGRAVGVVAAADVRAALSGAGHRVVPLVPGTASAVAARVEAVVVDLDGVTGVWDGALDATGVGLFLELRAALAAAAENGATCWVLSRGSGRHRLGALALLQEPGVVVVTARAEREPAHVTEDPGDAPLGFADLLRACPEATA